MSYTFEDLPSTQPSVRAIKVMLGGRQVAVLESLSHHMHYYGNERDWRLFRVSDRTQINDWPIMQRHRLEDIQRLVQAMDPSVFHKPASKTWAVVVTTVYGYRYFLGRNADGYASLDRVPYLYDYQGAVKQYEGFKDGQAVPFMPSTGDAIATIGVMDFNDLGEPFFIYTKP